VDSGAARHLGPAQAAASSLVWWRAEAGWHLAYLATTPPGLVGGAAVFDAAVPTSGKAGDHRNLTDGMSICPLQLVQIDSGVPLALFADGLDTAIHRLDPTEAQFVELSGVEGFAKFLTASKSGDVVAAVVSTSYEPQDVYVGSPLGPLVRISDM
jgi:hypothetical protein